MGSWCFHMTLKYEMQVSNGEIDKMLISPIPETLHSWEKSTLLQDGIKIRDWRGKKKKMGFVIWTFYFGLKDPDWLSEIKRQANKLSIEEASESIILDHLCAGMYNFRAGLKRRVPWRGLKKTQSIHQNNTFLLLDACIPYVYYGIHLNDLIPLSSKVLELYQDFYLLPLLKGGHIFSPQSFDLFFPHHEPRNF